MDVVRKKQKTPLELSLAGFLSDSNRTQTCNLLIRSQMLYSIELWSQVTFENAKERYRASFLIREYVITYEGGKQVKVVNSTEIYDDMLLNGITLDNADWVEWCDGTEEVSVERKWRRNVPMYRQVQGEPDRWEPDPNGMDTFSTPKGRVAKCPFNWQFRIK